MKDQEIRKKLKQLDRDDIVSILFAVAISIVIFSFFHYNYGLNDDDNYRCIEYKEQVTDDYATYCRTDCREIVGYSSGGELYGWTTECMSLCFSKATEVDKESICVLEAIARKPKEDGK